MPINLSADGWSGEFDYLKPNQVLVFGSNPAGRHGKGAAKLAVKFGAKYGYGFGYYGQTYAIVTKNIDPDFSVTCPIGKNKEKIIFSKTGTRSVHPWFIEWQIRMLYRFAAAHPTLQFIVIYQADGKNLNGFSAKEIWGMFHYVPVPGSVYFHQSMVRQFTP